MVSFNNHLSLSGIRYATERPNQGNLAIALGIFVLYLAVMGEDDAEGFLAVSFHSLAFEPFETTSRGILGRVNQNMNSALSIRWSYAENGWIVRSGR